MAEEAIEEYAKAYRIDAKQAELQLGQQQLATEFHDHLKEATQDWYAGMAFDHVPGFTVRVLLPTRAPREAFDKLAAEYEDDLEIVFDSVEYTSGELRARLVEAADVTRLAADRLLAMTLTVLRSSMSCSSWWLSRLRTRI